MANLTIRQQLLLVMTGLLLVSGGLSILLHLHASGRARDEVRETVDRIVDELVRRDMLRVDDDESRAAVTAFREGFGAGFVRGAAARDGAASGFEIVRPSVLVEEGDWRIVVEGQSFDEKLVSDEGFDLDRLAGAAVIPADDAAASRRTIQRLPDPIEAANAASLPREMVIAGAVLVVGFVLTWFVAGRLSGSLRVLAHRMESVANGDLDDDPGDVLAAALVGRRDEAQRVRAAFSRLLESLREKRQIERRAADAERLAAVGTLAAGVAHDVRNPLNTIGLSLEHLRDAWRPSDPESRRGFETLLDEIHSELRRMDSLVSGFLSLARTGEGTPISEEGSEAGVPSEPARLVAVVEECIRLFRQEASARGIDLVARLDEVGAASLDEGRFRRAIANLLLNAFQACEEASNAKASVRVELRREGSADPSDDEVVLSVRDNGCGMTDAALRSAMLPYWTTRANGVGLGLSIAQSFAERHGGRIEIHSETGQGTEVVIRLPSSLVDLEVNAA